MNDLEIYVKTAALGKTGIHWRNIESEEHQPIKVPELIQIQILPGERRQRVIVNDLIDEVKPSLMIFRNNQEQKVLLEITGIESHQRYDESGHKKELSRRLLNSIVLIANNSLENEELLRKIFYSAIQNFLGKDSSFSQMIEESVIFFGREEFRVDIRRVHEFITNIKLTPLSKSQDAKSEQNYQIKYSSTENVEKLAEEIRNNPLPKEWLGWDNTKRTDGVLVVVTEKLEQRTLLHQAGVWRGLATNVEEPILEKSNEPITNELTTSIPNIENSKKKENIKFIRLLIVLLLIVLTVLLLAILKPLSLQFPPQLEQNSQPQLQMEKTPQP